MGDHFGVGVTRDFLNPDVTSGIGRIGADAGARFDRKALRGYFLDIRERLAETKAGVP